VYDILIRGGYVVDGKGGPRRRADVSVRDGRIVAVGNTDEQAQRVIDAEGRIVAPGFIDVHTHYDAQVFWDGALTPSPFHGVTSVVGGNCGFSIAPLENNSAEYLMRMLARVEGIPLESLESGVPWDWRTAEEYLDRVDALLVINAGFMAGHSPIRRAVMGQAAGERAATEDEIRSMETLLRQALGAGCLGFSTSRGPAHTDGDRGPVPSRLAAPEEFQALSRVVSEFDGTSLAFIPESYGKDEAALMSSMSLAARRPMNWNVLFPSSQNVTECWAKLQTCSYADAAGAKVLALASPLPQISLRSFLSGFVLDAIPGWGEVMALEPAEKLRVLSNPAERQRLLELYGKCDNQRLLSILQWPRMLIVEAFTAETKRYEGRLAGDIAREEGKSAFDALLDIVCADELRTIFRSYTPDDSRKDWEARVDIMRDSRVLTGGSDAGAHLDMLATFAYTTTLLKEVVREHELMTVEELVRLFTDVPARLYGLQGRGVVAEGAIADIVIFDEATVGPRQVCTRFDLPGGAGRLYAEADGIDHVFVSGVEVLESGELTGASPGAALRAGKDTQGTELPLSSRA
jgi:N-acyl-D-aspartate/D-glutamate deacylase